MATTPILLTGYDAKRCARRIHNEWDPTIEKVQWEVPPELQMRFDMQPLSRGECVAVPGDIRASIDPNSTVDISHARRYARMPNLGYFASAGFPFTT